MGRHLWEAGMHNRKGALMLQNLLHALTRRWQQPRGGATAADTAHSTLFMRSAFSPEPQGDAP